MHTQTLRPPILPSPHVSMKKGEEYQSEWDCVRASGGNGFALMAVHALPAPGAYLVGMSKCLKWKHKVLWPGCHSYSHAHTYFGCCKND